MGGVTFAYTNDNSDHQYTKQYSANDDIKGHFAEKRFGGVRLLIFRYGFCKSNQTYKIESNKKIRDWT